jgi:ABC-type spermidine/putrescine transport system permease subunit II
MPFATPALLAGPQSALAIAMALSLATAMGTLLALVYRRTTGDAYNPDIAQSQIVLAALMALVMVVVGDQISRAFGAVGILSIMRFRVKMKGAGEALSLLGAVVVGMAAGVGMFREAVIGGCFLGLLTIVLATVFKPTGKPSSVLEEEA